MTVGHADRRFVDPHVVGMLAKRAQKGSSMLNIVRGKANVDAATLTGPQKSQAIIEFDLSGNVLTANENFLNALGYRSTLPCHSLQCA
jgi:hypothetical protein